MLSALNNRKPPKARRNPAAGRAWAIRLPRRIVNMLVEKMMIAAGRLTKPRDRGGRISTPIPDQIKPIDPGRAIRNPKAAAVPTAR